MTNILKLKEISKILIKSFPNPQTELHYTNHFTLLIAIILSAQTTDKMVNIATNTLFKLINTPQDLINLGIDELKLHIKILNYYNTKAQNIIKTAHILNQMQSIPNTLEDLMKLPGVGRKTANVFLNVALDKPTIAVDTHVFRLTNRIFNANFTKPEDAEKFLLQINSHSLKKHTHHLLILHGRYVCKAKKPDCKNCKISHLCSYFNQ
ncbi:endonuclease III [Candidatus Deianiraea vastatrix]|uniref:Endonuclease III n=1 Tax=Candidatus Deianiraea vastatrix TaxID=2163644 RepID=A0A5B8XEH0_9RICK|nr:endonuclease III [Candidatus Deianiraea vastatrix]QED23640.1 Endonuclease III [Candidatus Deianiraea vastatrix]